MDRGDLAKSAIAGSPKHWLQNVFQVFDNCKAKDWVWSGLGIVPWKRAKQIGATGEHCYSFIYRVSRSPPSAENRPAAGFTCDGDIVVCVWARGIAAGTVRVPHGTTKIWPAAAQTQRPLETRDLKVSPQREKGSATPLTEKEGPVSPTGVPTVKTKRWGGEAQMQGLFSVCGFRRSAGGGVTNF